MCYMSFINNANLHGNGMCLNLVASCHSDCTVWIRNVCYQLYSMV